MNDKKSFIDNSYDDLSFKNELRTPKKNEKLGFDQSITENYEDDFD